MRALGGVSTVKDTNLKITQKYKVEWWKRFSECRKVREIGQHIAVFIFCLVLCEVSDCQLHARAIYVSFTVAEINTNPADSSAV
jgi:hypothetical protein